jgi:hypothetical protein
MTASDPHDAIWELAEFAIREAFLLRSLLERLRTWPDCDLKTEKLQNWRKEIGLQLGNPEIADHSLDLLQKCRALPPEEQNKLLREVLNIAHSAYF